MTEAMVWAVIIGHVESAIEEGLFSRDELIRQEHPYSINGSRAVEIKYVDQAGFTRVWRLYCIKRRLEISRWKIKGGLREQQSYNAITRTHPDASQKLTASLYTFLHGRTGDFTMNAKTESDDSAMQLEIQSLVADRRAAVRESAADILQHLHDALGVVKDKLAANQEFESAIVVRTLRQELAKLIGQLESEEKHDVQAAQETQSRLDRSVVPGSDPSNS